MIIPKNVVFSAEKKQKEDNIAYLRCSIWWANTKMSLSLRQQINPERWSKEAQRCTPGSVHGANKQSAAYVNRTIAQLLDQIDRVFYYFEAREIIPTRDQLRQELDYETGKVSRSTKLAFFDAYDKFRTSTSQANDWSLTTISRFKTLRKYIEHCAPKLTFDTYNDDFLTALTVYLRDTLQLRNVTTMKYFSKLRQFSRWAQKNNLLQDNSVVSYSPKLKNPPPKVIYLTWEELMRVYDYKFLPTAERLARVRDVFCFCCFTSLRYSDVANLTRRNVHANHISVTTIKTADSLTIDLNKYSRAILDRYRGEVFERDRALPVISNQKYNDYIKSIGVLCEIDEPINEVHYIGNTRHECTRPKYELLSSHAARRTFICNALALGINATTVMKWTGHSDYKAMKPYIDVADKERAKAMALFDR